MEKIKWYVKALYPGGGWACYYPMAESKGLAIEMAKVERDRISLGGRFGCSVRAWTARPWNEKDEAARLKRAKVRIAAPTPREDGT